MTESDSESLLGKWVEVSMDGDRSREVFYGKGKIVHIFTHPPAREAIAIEFDQVKKGFFRKNKNRYLILQYSGGRGKTLQETFTSICSYARVLRLKNLEALKRDTYFAREVTWLGSAEIYRQGGLGTVPYP